MNLPDGVARHLRGLRHVGIVTDDREALLARLQAVFGVADDDIVRVPAPGEPDAETRFAFLTIGGVPYEVIEPVSDRMKEQLLRHRGVNHVCYNVDDLDAAIAAMAAAGVRLGHVTPGGVLEMPHARMAYFEPDDTAGFLVEFVEPRKSPRT